MGVGRAGEGEVVGEGERVNAEDTVSVAVGGEEKEMVAGVPVTVPVIEGCDGKEEEEGQGLTEMLGQGEALGDFVLRPVAVGGAEREGVGEARGEAVEEGESVGVGVWEAAGVGVGRGEAVGGAGEVDLRGEAVGGGEGVFVGEEVKGGVSLRSAVDVRDSVGVREGV